MNIIVHNRREVEFDLADLEVLIKDYIEDGGAIVSVSVLPLFFFAELPYRSPLASLNLDFASSVLRFR